MVLLAGVAGARADTIRDPSGHFFQRTFGDFRDGLPNARRQGKADVLRFFRQETCPFCARMEDTVLNRARVQDCLRQRSPIFAVDIKGGSMVAFPIGAAAPPAGRSVPVELP